MDKDQRRQLLLGSCAVSVIASIILFARGDKDTGIFVGLWAPTILALDTFVTTAPDGTHH